RSPGNGSHLPHRPEKTGTRLLADGVASGSGLIRRQSQPAVATEDCAQGRGRRAGIGTRRRTEKRHRYRGLTADRRGTTGVDDMWRGSSLVVQAPSHEDKLLSIEVR